MTQEFVVDQLCMTIDVRVMEKQFGVKFEGSNFLKLSATNAHYSIGKYSIK